MKKIGTISIALSFIFLGVSLLISKFDAELGYTVFKFWPAIFIILGLEFILSTVLNKDIVDQKKKFNMWIIFIIIIFLATDGVWSFSKTSFVKDIRHGNFFTNMKNSIKDGVNFSDESDGENKEFKFAIEENINDMNLNVTNADIKIEKSTNGKVSFDGRITLENGTSIDPKECLNISGNKGTLNLRRDQVKKLKGTLFISDNSKLGLEITNGRITGKANFVGIELNSTSSNATYDLEGFKLVDVKNMNGEIKVKNADEIVFSNINGNVEVENIQKIKGSNKNGEIGIKADSVKEVYVENNIGQIDFKTKDKNITLKADVKAGDLKYNSNSVSKGPMTKSLEKTLGTGDGKVTLVNNLGSIDINCRE